LLVELSRLSSGKLAVFYAGRLAGGGSETQKLMTFAES
jgi:hypothetical protein